MRLNYYLVLFLVLVGVFWSLFIPLSSRVANDFHYNFKELDRYFFNYPQTWRNTVITEGFGEYSVGTLWAWPKDFIYGIFSVLGLCPYILTSLIYTLPILIIGVFASFKLFYNKNISLEGIVASVVFFFTNTYFLLLVDGGQLNLAVTYSLLPLSYLFFKNSLANNQSIKDFYFYISILVISIFDIRILYLLIILIALDFILYSFIDIKKTSCRKLKRYFIIGLNSGIVLVGLNFYWILPSILAKHPTLPEGYSQVSQTSFLNFTTWKHALLILQPHWYLNVFGKVAPVRWEFLLIPVLAFLMPGIVVINKLIMLINIKNQKSKIKMKYQNLKIKSHLWSGWFGLAHHRRDVVFWTVVAVAGIFLTKGANPPFGEVYNFLFTNVPGFSLFRDSTKFFFLVALSYSVLIGYSVDFLSKKWKDSGQTRMTLRHAQGKLLQKHSWSEYLYRFPIRLGMTKEMIVPIVFIAYCLLLVSPVYTGRMTGMFLKPVYEKESFAVADIIEKDDSFSRIFFIPSRAPLGYSSPTHPSVEALRLLSKRPFAIGTVGTYEQFNYLREAPFMGELFAIAGIKYIYYPYPDTRRETLKQDNIDYYYAFLDQLTNLPWIEKRIYEPPVAVLQTKKTKDHIFLAENSYYVVGSDRIYDDLMEIPGFDLSNNALIFAEENPGVINEIDPNSKVVLYDKNETDLMMSMVDEDKFYFPASNIEREPSENIDRAQSSKLKAQNYNLKLKTEDNGTGKIWKRETTDFLWWRDFLQNKYGLDYQEFDFNGGWAIAEGDAIYDIPYTIYKNNETLFTRVMTSSRGGRIEFWQGEEKIGEIDTLDEDPEKVDIKLTGYKDVPDQISTYDKAEFGWSRVGKLTINNKQKTENDKNTLGVGGTDRKQETVNSKPLTIKTFGEINVINAIVTLSDGELDELEGKVEKLKDENRVMVVNPPSSLDKLGSTSLTTGVTTARQRKNDTPEVGETFINQKAISNKQETGVSYKRIDPTKYEVEITGLTKPSYLIFSETFDELWELNGQPAKKVYSLVNGFYVEKDGKYTLYFTPQKYVWPGLVVSGMTMVGIIGFLIISKQKTLNNKQKTIK